MADIKKQQELAAELSSKLWAMANDLRGNMEAYEFKNYILGLLFYKELSDRTEKFVAELLQEDNTTFEAAWKDEEYKEAIVDEMLIKLGYVLEPKYLFPEMLELIRKDEFSIDYFEEAINSIIASTQGQDSEADFDGLFEDMDLKSSKLGKEIKQRSKLIGKVLQKIDSIEVDLGDTDVDVLGTAYVTLIGLFAQTAGKKGGEFYTPTNMSKLVARLATVGLTKVLNVADCACGSGSLLLQVGEYVDVAKYYGQELTSSTYNLARMNMILHGIDYKNFSIINVDTLEDDTIFADEKYTIQVANPPYSTKWSADPKFMDDERFSPYGKLAPSSKADFAFIQHMVHHMANGDSRIAVLLPLGILSRGAAEDTIRTYLIKNLNVIDAVIGLPANCFQGTNIPVCCLILKKERNGNSDNICIIDASKYYTAARNMNYITDEDIDRIVNAYTERKEIDKFCHIASMDEIAYNDYCLSIPRYIDTFQPDEPVHINREKKYLEELQDKKATLLKKINETMASLGILEITDETKQKIFRGDIRFTNNGYPYPDWKEKKLLSLTAFDTAKTVESFEEGKYTIMDMGSVTSDGQKLYHKRTDTCEMLLKAGDLVMPKDDIGAGLIICKTAYIDENDAYVMGDHIYRLQFTSENPKFMHYYINSDIVQRELHRYVTGSAIKGVTYKSFKNVVLKLPCIEEQQKIADFLTDIDTIIGYVNEEQKVWNNIKKSLLQ